MTQTNKDNNTKESKEEQLVGSKLSTVSNNSDTDSDSKQPDIDNIDYISEEVSKGTNGVKHKNTVTKNGNKVGRPRKSTLKKSKNPVGRPRGDNSVIAEYKQRMLASPKSAKVLEAVLDAASDPDHKNFTAAAKLVLDRLLPVSAFEEAKNSGKGNSISITITGVDGSKTTIGQDIDDADFTEVDADED